MVAPMITQTESSGNESINIVLLSSYSVCDTPLVCGGGTILAYPRAKSLGRKSLPGCRSMGGTCLHAIVNCLDSRMHCGAQLARGINGRSRGARLDMDIDRMCSHKKIPADR